MEDNIIDLQRKVKVLNDKNNKMYKEIERLKNVYEKNLQLVDKLYLKDKEIERLKNIIETFEEELEREVKHKEEDTTLEHNTFITINSTLKSVLERFKELKGSE